MITHYLKVAVRHILKYKTQNLISVLGLSVGILCFSICLYCSRYIYDTNKCFDNYERIADIQLQRSNGRAFSSTSVTVIEDLRQHSFDEAEAFTFVSDARSSRQYKVEVSEGKELPYELRTMEVDSLFQRVFTAKVVQGSWEVASQTPNAVVLTRSIAEKMFPKGETPIGKRMVLMHRLYTSPDTTPRTGGIAYTVQAVIEDIPANTSLAFLSTIDMLTLNDSEGLIRSPRRFQPSGYGFALLRPGYTAATLDARIATLNKKYNAWNQDFTPTASPMGELFWDTSIASGFAAIASVLGVLILLTGLLNFFQFLIGTYLNRRREYGIRKVAGCNMTQLFIQLSVQAVLISLFAFLIAFCLIELISPSLHISLFNLSISIEKELLMVHAAEYMAGILLLGMLLSLLTAWRVRKVTVMVGMNANTTRGGKHRTRNVLLGVQFFICFLFVIGTAGLYLQAMTTSATLFNTLTRQEKHDILSFEMDYTFMKNEEKLALIDRIASHSAVIDKLPADISFLRGISGNMMYTEKDNPDSNIEVNIMSVPQNFFTFMNVPIRAGRSFETKEDMVADQRLAEVRQQDLMGMTLYDYEGGHTVCGISEEVILDTTQKQKGFVFLIKDLQQYVGHCYIKCAPGKAAEVKAHVEKTLREALPESVEIKVNTLMDDIIEEQALENSLKGIILFFSIVSLIITLLGVYSAITLDTERRQKEVAIRKVNGAGMKQIVMLFARLYITLLLVTALIALPLGYAVTVGMKQMYTVFFDNGPLFWCSIFLFVAAVTTLTVLFRILKIARINPAEVIKNE